jgi:predicted alpha/beta superfamily hydrolase
LQTYGGIDACGGRLAEEISDYIAEHPKLQRLSVFGHSMGGLIARYALGMPSLVYVSSRRCWVNAEKKCVSFYYRKTVRC